jgi:hypothetical protein
MAHGPEGTVAVYTNNLFRYDIAGADGLKAVPSEPKAIFFSL